MSGIVPVCPIVFNSDHRHYSTALKILKFEVFTLHSKKIKKSFYGLLLTLFLSLGQSTHHAQAALITYDVFDHPDWGIAGNPPSSFFILFGGAWDPYRAVDLEAVFDTVAGTGHISGNLIHHVSGDPYAIGDPWFIDMALSGIMPFGYVPSQPLPHDQMFEELLTAAGMIKFTDVEVNLTPLVANPSYDGPTSFVESMAAAFSRYDAQTLEGHGWLYSTGEPFTRADFHIVLRHPRTPDYPEIPEPATLFLMGSGLLAGIFRSAHRCLS